MNLPVSEASEIPEPHPAEPDSMQHPSATDFGGISESQFPHMPTRDHLVVGGMPQANPVGEYLLPRKPVNFVQAIEEIVLKEVNFRVYNLKREDSEMLRKVCENNSELENKLRAVDKIANLGISFGSVLLAKDNEIARLNKEYQELKNKYDELARTVKLPGA